MKNRDYTLIVDRSGGKSRWEVVQESMLAIARNSKKLDAEGMTVYTSSRKF